MVTRALTLEGAGLTLELEGPDFAALPGGDGFGLVGMDVQWFTGAGPGSTWRGSRPQRRTIPLPILVRGKDADQLQERMSLLAIILDPDNSPATLRQSQGQEAWLASVVRESGGDPVMGQDTNGSTWADMNIVLGAGKPHWVRERPEVIPIRAGGLGRGLLGQSDTPDVPPGELDTTPLAYGEGVYGAGEYGGGGTTTPPPAGSGNSLTRLRVSSGQAMGPVEFQNPGDAATPPLVVVHGPATTLTSQSPRGELLTWAGDLLTGQHLFIDHETRTVTDDTGANRYTELGPAPLFWTIPARNSTGFITLEGATRDSGVDVTYRPRRWLVM